MAVHIYKIFRASEWQQANSDELFFGSSDDIRDGFIHFSTRDQLETSAQKHFADETEIHVACYLSGVFTVDTLKWEKSRGGAFFPHLYCPLQPNSHTAHWRLTKAPNGQFDFTDVPKDT